MSAEALGFLNPTAMIGNASTGILGYMGQREANEMNLQIARESMDFEERMSSTAHQRAVNDLREAGLNPVLAAAQPASTPQGKTATMENEMAAGINSAMSFMQIAKQHAEVRNINAETERTKNMTDMTEPLSQIMSTVGKYLEPGTNSAKSSAKPAMESLGNVLKGTANEVIEGVSNTAKKAKGKYDQIMEGASEYINNVKEYWSK